MRKIKTKAKASVRERLIRWLGGVPAPKKRKGKVVVRPHLRGTGKKVENGNFVVLPKKKRGRPQKTLTDTELFAPYVEDSIDIAVVRQGTINEGRI